jgi:hypothetical protein
MLPIALVAAGGRYMVKHPWKTFKFILKVPLVIPAAYTV